MSESQYLSRLSGVISGLQRQPAHLTQSAEESSLDAWLEKYPYYRTPQRSISYYEKGELLGVILDLQLREVTHGTKSLRDLFQWMNQNYVRQGRFYPDSDGVRLAAEALSGSDFKDFFGKYVAGTDEIPWDQFFTTVGLHLVSVTAQVADPGFSTTRNFNEAPVVSEIITNSEAARAGLAVGDAIIEINGQPAGRDFERRLAKMAPGAVIHVKIRNRQGDRNLQWALAAQDRVDLQLKDLNNITTQQKDRRTAWLKGESEGETAGAVHP
jgi:predicted metalloprotease with PDZ domain